MAENTRDELLEHFRKGNPRTRKTTKRVIEGKADQDSAAFIQEQLSFVEPDLTVRQIDFISSRTCSFGHLQDQQTRLVGVCEVCGAYTCSTAGCSYNCCRCGRAVCKRHVREYDDGEMFCPDCNRWAFLRWLVLGKRR